MGCVTLLLLTSLTTLSYKCATFLLLTSLSTLSCKCVTLLLLTSLGTLSYKCVTLLLLWLASLHYHTRLNLLGIWLYLADWLVGSVINIDVSPHSHLSSLSNKYFTISSPLIRNTTTHSQDPIPPPPPILFHICISYFIGIWRSPKDRHTLMKKQNKKLYLTNRSSSKKNDYKVFLYSFLSYWFPGVSPHLCCTSQTPNYTINYRKFSDLKICWFHI